MESDQQFIDLERGFWAAAGDPKGGYYYQEHFHDNGILILPFDGGMLDKSAVIPIIPTSEPWTKYDFSNLKIIQIEANSISLCYEVYASHGTDQFHAYVASIYVRQADETWKMLSHQQTPV